MDPFEINEALRYLRCNACGQITAGVTWGERQSVVRSCCGATGPGFLMWPNLSVVRCHRLSSRFALSHKNPDDTDTALILLAAAAEAALDDLLWDMMIYRLGLTPRETNMAFNKLHTRKQRLDYFSGKVKTSAAEALRGNTVVPHFMEDWDTVVSLRNVIAHGRPSDYRTEPSVTGPQINLLPKARRFREQFFDGFAQLTNFVYRDGFRLQG